MISTRPRSFDPILIQWTDTDNTLFFSRNDKFGDRVSEVNRILRKECSDRNLALIDHNNIIASSHLNRSRIHLNRTGSRLLEQNFMFNIKN